MERIRVTVVRFDGYNIVSECSLPSSHLCLNAKLAEQDGTTVFIELCVVITQ